VPAERRSQDAVVEAGEQCLPADAALLGEHGDLGQRLGDNTEEKVVAELDRPRQLAVPDVSRTRAEQFQIRAYGFEGRTRAGDGESQPPDRRHFRITHYRRGEKRAPLRGQRVPALPGRLRRDRRAVDHDGGRMTFGSQACRACERVDEILRRADGDEHDVRRAEFGSGTGDLRPGRGKRLSLCPGPVKDSDVTPGGEQPANKRDAHSPGTQPAEPVSVTSVGHIAYPWNPPSR